MAVRLSKTVVRSGFARAANWYLLAAVQGSQDTELMLGTMQYRGEA